MKTIGAADLVWIAMASLSREFPDRTGFPPDEIRRRASELEPGLEFAPSTIPTHIGRHCVANKKPDPGRHRKLYALADGTYRLFRDGDFYDPGRRNGKVEPDPGSIPEKYRPLVVWYRQAQPAAAPKEDPLLALRGLGKELWRELGGGEKFIRELRANWYGPGGRQDPLKAQQLPRKKRAG